MAAAACGPEAGTALSTHASPLRAVSDALGATARAGSARALLVTTGPNDVTTSSIRGVLDWRHDSYDFVTVNSPTTASAGNDGTPFEQRRVGGTIYMRPLSSLPAQPSPWVTLPSTFDAHQVPAAIAGPLTGPLEVLGGVRPPASDLGAQQVDGVTSEHYRVGVCVPVSLHGDVPADVLSADVWVDSAGRIRQVRTSVLMTGNPHPAILTSVLTLSDFGTAFSTTVPSVGLPGGAQGQAIFANGC